MRMRYNLRGGVPERPKGPDCKSGGFAFEGSNPSPTTKRKQLLAEKSAGSLSSKDCFGNLCGSSSIGRASAFQAECRGFEPRLPLTACFTEIGRTHEAPTKLFQKASKCLLISYKRQVNRGGENEASWSFRCASSVCALVAQAVEHFHGKEGVTSSILVKGSLMFYSQPISPTAGGVGLSDSVESLIFLMKLKSGVRVRFSQITARDRMTEHQQIKS